LVFNIPVDYVVWTTVARVFTTADNLANQLPGISGNNSGYLTLSRGAAAVQRLNWKVYERNEALIVATDKPVSYHGKIRGRRPGLSGSGASRLPWAPE
jgi:hypothetical protein